MNDSIKHSIVEGILMLFIIVLVVKIFVYPYVAEKYELQGSVNMTDGKSMTFTTTNINFVNDTAKKNFVGDLKKHIADVMYPVGSIYISCSRTDNPAGYLGVGTWVQLDNEVYLENNTAEKNLGKTFGSSTYTLKESQLPKHKHGIVSYYDNYDYWHAKKSIFTDGDSSKAAYDLMSIPNDCGNNIANKDKKSWDTRTTYTETVGKGDNIDNRPKHTCVFMWKRTA